MSDIAAVEARRAYDEYFRMCVSHPHLASFDGAKRKFHPTTAPELWNSYEDEASRYVWFVAYALKVFDDLLMFDAETYWKKAIRFQLDMHVPALKAIWQEHWSSIYSAQLGEIVDNAIEGRK